MTALLWSPFVVVGVGPTVQRNSPTATGMLHLDRDASRQATWHALPSASAADWRSHLPL
jgi:hypothetical protein